MSVENTLGVALPEAVGFIFCKLGEWLPGVPLEFFTRNEFGIANGAILKAVVNGANVTHTVMKTRPPSPPHWLAKSSRAINIEHLKAEVEILDDLICPTQLKESHNALRFNSV